MRRRQIDRLLRKSDDLRAITVPRGGWIAEIRGIIGMRASQLATRLGVVQSSVSEFERAEANGAITLNTLEKVATALNCRLVYALVPEESFENMVRARAELVAGRIVGVVNHTMALEDQQTGHEERQESIADLATQLVRTLPRELWDEER